MIWPSLMFTDHIL